MILNFGKDENHNQVLIDAESVEWVLAKVAIVMMTQKRLKTLIITMKQRVSIRSQYDYTL
jgi:hypothetical protein